MVTKLQGENRQLINYRGLNHRDRNCGLNSKLAGENRNRGLNSAN
jgi:hypothetical protein